METPNATEPIVEATSEEVDLAQIKTMLDLPETASDLDLITVLVNLVANLQEKYEGLLADAVAMEDTVVNRDLVDFKDVVNDQTEAFWKEQLLTNRTGALQTLNELAGQIRTRPAATAAPVVEDRVIPLRNRMQAIQRTVSGISTEQPTPSRLITVAAKIRNRAHEITKAENVPFIIAFSRAEKEITQQEK